MIGISELTVYLAEAGWSATGSTWHGGAIWSRGPHEVLVPPHDGMSDAASRVHELLLAVAEAEDRPPGEIVRDARFPLLDRALYRADVVAGVDGFVALPSGLDALRGIQDMLSTVASPEALSEVLLRTTIEQRLVATVLVPGTGDQRILERLYRATEAVHTAVRTDSVDALTALGVTRSFCTALGRLTGPDRSGSFDLEFRWARGVPSVMPDAQLNFGAGTGEQLRQVTRRLQERGQLDKAVPDHSGTTTAEGRVVGLQDVGTGADRWRIKVDGVITSASRTTPSRAVWIRLATQEQYDQAWDAHRSHQPVRVRGRWRPDGRVRVHADPDGLMTLPDP
ncbi:hypothetical protein E1263_20955 [Kribbella antibiotica]|uniref:Uncharacterized protein n=1 Tax=Kribbella antibiotica TaxID=190195 RepID=A0A4V2YPF2_9ACTN|nr:hypothetical protein [Kribbella antibiotica]TDD58027.1 hypothetical protein E1263_20955 [Kribbella antibiotica]